MTLGKERTPLVRSLWVVAILLTATSIARAAGVDTVTVWFDDGRVLTAEVDQRTDEHRLWLRFSRPLITLASSTRWQKVVQASYNEKIYRADEFRTLALSLRDKAPSRSRVEELSTPGGNAVMDLEAGKTVAESGSRSRETSGLHQERPNSHESGYKNPSRRYPAGQTNQSQVVLRRPPNDRFPAPSPSPPRVQSLMLNVELANWDSDVEVDGLLLHIYPLNRDWVPVAIDGTLQIEVIGQKFARRRQPTRFFELARTSHRVRKQDFGPTHVATYRIPFRTVHPEFQLDVGTYGLVHARLGIPGQGSFEASVQTRLRTFDPVRDQLQLERGKRFFASERTRGAGP